MEPTTSPPARPGDLVGIGEIRGLLVVGKARGYTITRDRAFPAPWYEGADGQTRLWLRADVGDWVVRYRPELVARLDEQWPGWRGGPRTGGVR